MKRQDGEHGNRAQPVHVAAVVGGRWRDAHALGLGNDLMLHVPLLAIELMSSADSLVHTERRGR
jgi:hypothetical protein